MDVNQIDNSSKIKSIKLIKTEEMISSKEKSKKSSFSYIKKILNIFRCCGNVFSSLINIINSCLSKCSIYVQFPLFLIPISIIMILLIFFIHIHFYSNLYGFNFSKTFKEEFYDIYLTKIDDFNVELTSVIVKDAKLDIENQLFFQVYFKELASVGVLDENKNIFKSFSDNSGSTSLYSKLNNINNINVNFSIHEEFAKEKIDERYDDKLGNFAKIYYYMFPFIWYESLQIKPLINQSFFIAYEVGETISFDYITWQIITIRGMASEFLYFRYPKNSVEINNNFAPNDYLLNPYVDYYDTHNYEYRRDYYYYINWFRAIDYDFRSLSNTTGYDFYTNISFAHINQESHCNINKTFVTCASQYIKQDNREYIIHIVFY